MPSLLPLSVADAEVAEKLGDAMPRQETIIVIGVKLSPNGWKHATHFELYRTVVIRARWCQAGKNSN
jgi:hypothetical protein